MRLIKYEDILQSFEWHDKENRKLCATFIRRLPIVPAGYEVNDRGYKKPVYDVDELIDVIDKKLRSAKSDKVKRFAERAKRVIKKIANEVA